MPQIILEGCLIFQIICYPLKGLPADLQIHPIRWVNRGLQTPLMYLHIPQNHLPLGNNLVGGAPPLVPPLAQPAVGKALAPPTPTGPGLGQSS